MTVYKVIRFRADGLDASPDWDLTARCSRAVHAVPVTAPGFPPPAFAAVHIHWFTTADDALAAGALVGDASTVVAAEHVVRGPDDADQLWDGADERFLMMSFGKRSPELTLPQFLERWRAEAGNLGGEVVPADVRGRAYVQNHPLVLDGHEWPFDAVNEVHCARLDDLRRRRDWFAARQDAALRSPTNHFMDPDRTGSLFLRARMSTTKET